MFPRILHHSQPRWEEELRVILLFPCNCRQFTGLEVVDEIDVCFCFEELLGFGTCCWDWGEVWVIGPCFGWGDGVGAEGELVK